MNAGRVALMVFRTSGKSRAAGHDPQAEPTDVGVDVKHRQRHEDHVLHRIEHGLVPGVELQPGVDVGLVLTDHAFRRPGGAAAGQNHRVVVGRDFDA
jgi:hypothetical protein